MTKAKGQVGKPSSQKDSNSKVRRRSKPVAVKSKSVEVSSSEPKYEYKQPSPEAAYQYEPRAKTSSNKLLGENKYFSLIVFTIIAFIVVIILWSSLAPNPTAEFEVQSQATMPVELNVAEISFVTSSEGSNPAGLVEIESLKSQEIENYFLNKGVSSKDLHTNQSFFSTSIQTSLPGQSRLQTFYRVVMRDADEAFIQEAVSGLYQIGLDRMEAVRFSSQEITEICEELRLEAMKQAEQRAIEVISRGRGGVIMQKRYETLVDCVGDDFSYFANSELEQEKARKIYGLGDSSVSFSSQRQELKTQVKLTVTYQT